MYGVPVMAMHIMLIGDSVVFLNNYYIFDDIKPDQLKWSSYGFVAAEQQKLTR